MKFGVLIGVFFYLVTLVWSATYHVSVGGNDAAEGTSPETAWRSIAKVNATAFLPGDTVVFRRGDVWRDGPLFLSSSGEPEAFISYGAYGTGARPGLFGSIQVIGWTHVSENIWRSTQTIPLDPWMIGYDGPEIFFEENDGDISWGVHQNYSTGFSNLRSEYDWTWNEQRIYIHSPSDPNSRYSGVEVPQLPTGIFLMDRNHVAIEHLAIKFYGDSGIRDQYATVQLSGLRVTHCEIAYIGRKNGGAAYGLSVHHSNARYAHNEIHNCGRRGISLTLYNTSAITQSNVVVENNHFHHGWHTTSLDCSTTGPHTIENIYFRNNLVEGDPGVALNGVNPNSNHIFSDNQSGGSGVLRNLFISNNVFTWAHGSSVKISRVAGAHIWNNTFWNFNPTLHNWQAHVFLSNTPSSPVSVVRNNVFVCNSVDNRWTAVKIDEAYRAGVSIDRNLYHQTGIGQRFMWINEGTSYRIDQWSTYRSTTGYDLNSPAPADPGFMNPPSNLALQEDSPARSMGEAVAWITHDYQGNAMNNPPDLGAFQFVPHNRPPVLLPVGNQSTPAGQSVHIVLEALDPDGQLLEYSATGNAPGL